MKQAAYCLVGIIFCCSAALAQHPAPLGDIVTTPGIGTRGRRIKDEPLNVPRPERRRTLDTAQLKHDAETLSQLAQTIPPGVDQVQKGTLPRDLLQNLKRIEKLSRHLRRQLAP